MIGFASFPSTGQIIIYGTTILLLALPQSGRTRTALAGIVASVYFNTELYFQKYEA